MNNYLYQEAVKDAVKDKFKGQKQLVSRYSPLHPYSAERELQRLANAYIRLLNKELKAELPQIMLEYKRYRSDDTRMDAFRDLARIVKDKLLQIVARFEKSAEAFNLEQKIEKIARQAQNASVRDWKRIVKRTLGVEILESYYNDAFYNAIVQKWVSDNVNKIKSIPQETLGNMEQILLEGYEGQKTIRTIAKELQDAYGMSRSKAKAIARDQMGTLSGQITEMQQRDAGITKYKWSSSNDERVRDCHAEFNGHIFEWDNPPEEWYDTKSRGRVYTGKYFNPGQSYGCRCVAIPVFDYDNLDIPIKGVAEDINKP